VFDRDHLYNNTPCISIYNINDSVRYSSYNQNVLIFLSVHYLLSRYLALLHHVSHPRNLVKMTPRISDAGMRNNTLKLIEEATNKPDMTRSTAAILK
jgi:hypothetical protein